MEMNDTEFLLDAADYISASSGLNEKQSREWGARLRKIAERLAYMEQRDLIDDGQPPSAPRAELEPEDIVIDAQHDETGRMWRGRRIDLPQRYREIGPVIAQPPSAPAEKEREK